MKVLVIGNGGREHALCISVKKSPLCDELFCLPGSDAISALAECHAIDVNNSQKIIDFCLEKKITFVIIGPEVPLTIGLVDRKKQYRCFWSNSARSNVRKIKNLYKRNL